MSWRIERTASKGRINVKESRNIPKGNFKTKERNPISIRNVITILLIVFIIFSLAFLGYKELIQDNAIEPQPIKQVDSANQVHDSKVVVYYFHGTYRCTTCLNIEKYSQEAVEFYFQKEIQERKLEFIVLNVDEPQNKHFIKDYKLYAQSLVVVLYKDSKQVKWKNLERVWDLVDYRYKFYEYVKQEVEEYLQEAL